jgi:hypothetical protein
MVSDPLAHVLRSGRDALNAQFAAARRLYPELDAAAFRAFLETTVDPLAQATIAARPDRLADVVMAAYELGLELVGKRLVGPVSPHAVGESGWRAVASAAAPLVAESPRRVLASIANALHQLATTPGGRPEQWLRELPPLAAHCPDAETLLRLGQILAWRSGLAHYRASALAVADSLPEALALAAVGGSGSWAAVRARLADDPWFLPSLAAGDETERTIVHAVGAFRGFGGVFSRPPRIARRAAQLIVTSGDEAWLLTADAFGATFHRAGGEGRAATSAAAPAPTLPSDVRVADGALTLRGHTFAAPVCGEVTSVSDDPTTLAITSSLSHSVALVARTALP